MTETHTYPDGSQRVGCPPFPKLSPKEEHELALRGETQAPKEPEPKPRAKPGPKPKAAQE